MQHSLCSPKGTFLSGNQPQTSKYEKARPGDRGKTPKEKICAFAAFLETVPKYPIRATGERSWCQPEVLMVRKAWQPKLEAAGHVASAVSQQRSMDAWRSACSLPFSFLFSLKLKPIGPCSHLYWWSALLSEPSLDTLS